MSLYIGIDVGTSGCRAVAIDEHGELQGHAAKSLPAPRRGERGRVEQDPEIWWSSVMAVLRRLLGAVDPRSVRAIAVDGTSASLLLADAGGRPVAPALMYSDARAVEEAARIAAVAPSGTAAQGPGSALAKLLWLQARPEVDRACYALHQADWIAGRLCERFGFSDSNNALKLGYDPVNRIWPEWLERVGVRCRLLPKVVAPGTPVGCIGAALAGRLGLPPETTIVTGTTDSTAAALASGVSRPGDAVTSLGSTLVLKVVSERPLFSSRYGVYSQPLGDVWLVGGASNSGGAVLRRYFSDADLERLSARIDARRRGCLEYYPLPDPGERFPVADPDLQPRLTPRPRDDVRFLQGLLEGIARIERRGYRLLAELGAPFPTSVRSVGGGARNATWHAIRSGFLGVPLLEPEHDEAAYGTALLARRGAVGQGMPDLQSPGEESFRRC